MPAHPDTYAVFYDHIQEGKAKLYIEIKIKGNKNTSFSRPAEEKDKTDYPGAWNHYKSNSFDYGDGTPLKALPGTNYSQILEYQAIGIVTVEDLANAGETTLNSMPGLRNMKKRALAYLAALSVEEEPEPVEDVEPVNEELMKIDSSVIPSPQRTSKPKGKKRGPKPKGK